MEFDNGVLIQALQKLGERLHHKNISPVRLVVCGGSALIAMGLIGRTTEDVDVVALVSEDDELYSPAPFPTHLEEAVHEVALLLDLPEDWLNYGPSRDSGGLFHLGLPEGLLSRANRMKFGAFLEVFFISRLDQIYFKVFAAADSMGVHVSDLMGLNPSSEEIEHAARWCMHIDPSEEFRSTVISMLEQLGYGNAVEAL